MSTTRARVSPTHQESFEVLTDDEDIGNGKSMSGVFGVSGPKDVEALTGPTRQHHSKTSSGTAVAAKARPSITHKVEISTEDVDFFDTSPSDGRFDASMTWSGDNGQGQSLRARRGMQRISPSSSRAGSSRMEFSQRFARPLGSEGEGSVFPVELSLPRRRALEVEFIQRFDRQEINTHVGEFWFMIDAEWMTDWVEFAMGNMDVPPGPISNYNLFDKAGTVSSARRESLLVQHAASARSRNGVMASRPDLKLRAGLQKVRDYRAVHPLIWYIFREIYATDEAPEVCRWKADIYSDEVAASRKLRVEQATHTKAVYELRRFSQRLKNEVAP